MSLRDAYEIIKEAAARKKKADPLPPAPAQPSVPVPPPSLSRQQRDLHLWQTWKDSNEHPDHLAPLLSAVKPIMRQQVNRYAGNVPIPKPALEAEVTRLTVDALRAYNPTRGAQINTHVISQLRGLQRYVIKNQNFSRITETRAHKIGQYQRAKALLHDSLGREPTVTEVADEMKVSVRTVEKLAREMRPDLLASAAENDPFLDEEPRSREMLRLMYPYEFTPDEQKVFEFLLGLNGRPVEKSTGKVARQLKMSDSKVSQLRAAIAKKAHKYLHE